MGGTQTIVVLMACAAVTGACGGSRSATEQATRVIDPPATIEAPAGAVRPPFSFSKADEELLDEVQRGAFNYLWNAADPRTGMVRDRTSKSIVSIAGVGFQLSALPVAVERGWVTREDAGKRAELILRSISANPDNRKAGLFYHFLDGATAGQPKDPYERVVSTIDSALFFCGAITAGSYFGGAVREMGDQLVEAADWSFFVARPGAKFAGEPKSHEMGSISLAWKPDHQDEPGGEGKLVPYFWLDAGDEQKLVTFLAVSAPRPSHRVPADMYYKLRRQLGSHGDSGTFAWFPYSGPMFTHFFAHCWINYAAVGVDEPAKFTDLPRARVDWWENSRRAVRMHKLKTTAKVELFPGLGEHAWGLTASDVKSGYAVPGLFPERVSAAGEVAARDYSTYIPKDDFGNGTLAPYGAGSCIMFDPAGSVAAMRRFKELRKADGTPLAWNDPTESGFGFPDAFNVREEWTAPDCLAIDQGPLILAIENARTGLIWSLFGSHPYVKLGSERLGWRATAARSTP